MNITKDDLKEYTPIMVMLGVVLLIVIIIGLSLDKPAKIEENPFIKSQVDSLARANAELQTKQATLDSLSKDYESKIQELDWKINNIGQSKTIIKEYYHEKIKEPVTYTPKQVDSFFKDRYKY